MTCACVVGDVGGGFGMKTGAYPEDLALAHAARALKRPLKWRAERLEEFLSAVHGRDVVSHAEMALDKDGKVLAIRVKAVGNTGAYATGTGILIPLVIGPWVTTSIYDITAMDLQLSAVMTHTNTIGRVPRCGAPRSDLPDRTPDGCGGARNEARPRRAAPAQHDPAEPVPVHQPDGAGVRLRRVREDPRPGPEAGRLERLRRAARGVRSARASCAAAASRRSSSGPAAWRTKSA